MVCVLTVGEDVERLVVEMQSASQATPEVRGLTVAGQNKLVKLEMVRELLQFEQSMIEIKREKNLTSQL